MGLGVGLIRQEPQRSRVELGVFLFLVLPSLIFSSSLSASGQLSRMSFSLLALAIIFRDLALLALVVFFVWQTDDPARALGWKADRPARPFDEALLGILIFIPLTFALPVVEQGLRRLGLPGPPKSLPAFTHPQGGGQAALATFFVAVVAICEESIFRGYLMLRLRSISRSPAFAVFLSAAIFALGHGYEGEASLVIVFLLGALLGGIYYWRASLIAPAVIHFLVDFSSIVLAAIIKPRS